MSGSPESTPADAPERAAGGRWQPGRSPNPGGRPKALAAVVEAARAEGLNSIKALVRLRDDPDQPGTVQHAAANSLLDRGFGKATVGEAGEMGEQVFQIITGIQRGEG